MASCFVMTNQPTEIEYSIADNRVRLFELRGEVLFDEEEVISVDGWKDRLVEFVKAQGINKKEYLPSFVYGLIDEGLI